MNKENNKPEYIFFKVTKKMYWLIWLGIFIVGFSILLINSSSNSNSKEIGYSTGSLIVSLLIPAVAGYVGALWRLAIKKEREADKTPGVFSKELWEDHSKKNDKK